MNEPAFEAKRVDSRVYIRGMDRKYEIALVDWLKWLKENTKERYNPITGLEKIIKALDKNDSWDSTPLDKDETHKQNEAILRECGILRGRLQLYSTTIQGCIYELSQYYQSYHRPRRFGEKPGYVEAIQPNDEFELPARVVSDLLSICDIASSSMNGIIANRSAFLQNYQKLRDQIDEAVTYPVYVWDMYGDWYTTIEENYISSDVSVFDCQSFIDIMIRV